MKLGKLLRHNCRHMVYFPGDWELPQLNPYSSSSHTAKRKRTKKFIESLWLFRVRQRLFAFAGNHLCGDRQGLLNRSHWPKQDTWNIGPDGNRTCSFCGSIHFDDFLKIARLAAHDDRYAIESCDKNYKYYVRQPDVHNAGDGAIKFYTTHLPKVPREADVNEINLAIKLSCQRFVRMTQETRERNAKAEA